MPQIRGSNVRNDLMQKVGLVKTPNVYKSTVCLECGVVYKSKVLYEKKMLSVSTKL